MTSGIQDIMTLNTELPQITPEKLQLTAPPEEEGAAPRKKNSIRNKSWKNL